MSDTFAVIAGKLSAKAIRAIGAGLGSNLPGRVSLAISPTVLSNLSRQSRKGVLAVSGTNLASEDILDSCSLAIASRVKLSALAGLILPYPTRAEAGKRAASTYFMTRLFSPRTKRLVR